MVNECEKRREEMGEVGLDQDCGEWVDQASGNV